MEKEEISFLDIIKSRRSTRRFKPDMAKKKRSTTFWHEYPYLNADIFGKIGQKQCTIRIAINWYSADTDYPCYEIRLERGADEELLNKFRTYNNDSAFEVRENCIIIYPNPKDKKEKTIEISYLGIAYFLNKLYSSMECIN